uniref:Tr-type G domain-containing protein n=1 Tax=Angiostrongylus cantonensis TaxID=6313 RepID=A0A158P716_ANGCA
MAGYIAKYNFNEAEIITIFLDKLTHEDLDYFPSFTLPANDTLFDDLDLDSCQMYDFVKKNTRKTEDHYLDKEFTKLLDELLDELPTTSGSESLDSSATTQTTATIRSFSYEETTVAYATTTTATSVATSVATTAATTAATTTVSTTAKPTTITTTRSTSTIASPNTTQPADKPNIKGEYNDYADVTVDVVPNERENSSISENFSTTTEPPKTSPRSRLFSDDSWEQTPPNFRYSSLRVLANGGVTPLNIDTTTLFGFDDDDEGEANDVSDDDEDKDDKAGVADSYEDSERNKGKDQVSTELKTTQPIGLLEVKLDSNRDDVVQQEDDIPTKHQSGEAREFVAQSTASTAEHNVKTTLIETVMESDNKSGNDLDKRLNLLRPSSTSPPVLPVPLTDGVKTKEQVWKEFNRNFGEGIHSTERLTESDEEEVEEELLQSLVYTDAPAIVNNSSELPEVNSNWLHDEALMMFIDRDDRFGGEKRFSTIEDVLTIS